jgi:hypothetical protein
MVSIYTSCTISKGLVPFPKNDYNVVRSLFSFCLYMECWQVFISR